MELKPQDTLLVLKYWSLKQSDQEASVRGIADSIGVSASEVSKGAKRLIASRLLVERSGGLFAESSALLEWIGYGVRYAYPLESIGYGRGMATSWNCPVLESEMVPSKPPFVWPTSGGNEEGVLIKPFHESIPYAASQDEDLYRILAVLDAIRGGKPRELTIARKILANLIKGA